MSDKKAVLLLFAISIMWATSFIFSSIAMESGMSGTEVVFFRFLVSTVLLYIFFRKKLTYKALEKNAIKTGLVSGMITTFSFFFEMLGIKLSNTTKAGFLTGLSVTILPFIYFVLFREKPKHNSLVAGALTVIGVGFLSLTKDFVFELGDILLIITAVCYACNSTAVANLSKGCSMLQVTYLQFFVVMVLTGAMMPFTRGVGYSTADFICLIFSCNSHNSVLFS